MAGNEKGSVVLEAAIALPLFVSFVLVFLFFLSVAQTKTALRDAVDEAVKSSAAHAYPIDLIVHTYRDRSRTSEVEAAIERFLPYEIKMLLGWNKERKEDEGQEKTVYSGEKARMFEAWLKPIILSYADESPSGRKRLSGDKLIIRSVTIPNFSKEESSYFGITAEYDIPLPIPFINKKITLIESAYERCWVGDK
ncbi:TadE family protein [Paenibacillus thermotolerans]|uniref:TadE family protein n=1 Tax=Paenibacillus thermotolerans TaxID=3027807 RepID=UPI002368CDA4|nr:MULTISPECIES: TadE family protein [unclassified Paenibacillus]